MKTKIKNPHILVIDDSLINRQLISFSLEDQYHISLAEDGHSGLILAKQKPHPDLILLDILMPGMDGYQVIRRLNIIPELQDIPVIFLTAKDTKKDEAYGLKLGAVDYINKPINIELLKLRIAHQLKLKRYINKLQEMREKEKIAAQIIENSLEGVMITDKKGVIFSVNKTFSKITQYSNSEAIGNTAKLLHSGKHDVEFYEKMWKELIATEHWEGEIWNRRKDGAVYQEWLDISTVKDDFNQINYYVARFMDLATCKKAETRLHFLAHYDQLTELPNRTLFTQRLAQSINSAERSGKRITVFFMDLDGFKAVNDSLGHNFGDLLLQQVAKRLQLLVRKIDIVSRIGGDEFTFIANEITKNEQIIILANKILGSFSSPFIIQGREIFIGTSIGISVFPDDTNRGSDLVKYADTAMYQAKENGRNQYCFYTKEMGNIAKGRLNLLAELRKAIKQNELVLYYQPQYDLKTGKMIGLEALIRWLHPRRGLLPPAAFLPEAEKSDLIIHLGEWVLNRAAQQVNDWHEQKLLSKQDKFRIAVNISAKHFQQKEFMPGLREVLKKYDINNNWLELEITEQSLVTDIEKMIIQFDEIKKMNISLAIDDFGTGYSSMSYLKKFPIDTLKIDRSFIKDINVDQDDEAIIKAIIQMAHSLGIQVLAEGVETDFQKQFLQNLDCDMVQGYFYSKPLPAEDVDFSKK